MDQFDAYHKWLGIPPSEQPPNHYRLLGLALFEVDPDVIDAAANRQMTYLQQCATGSQVALSQKILNEVAAARVSLLNAKKKRQYDAALQAKLSGAPTSAAGASVEPTSAIDLDSLRQTLQAPKKVSATSRRSWLVMAGVLVTVIAAGYWVHQSSSQSSKGSSENNRQVSASSSSATQEKSSTNEPDASQRKIGQAMNRESGKSSLTVSDSSQLPPAQPDAASAQKLSQEVVRSDFDRLQGRWECAFEETAGTELTALELATMKKMLTVDGTQVTLRRVTSSGISGEYQGEISLGWDGERRLFDFTGTDPNGMPVEWLGVYEFDGDIFKVCYRIRSENDLSRQRADTFGTFKYSERVLSKFRRASVPMENVKDVVKTEPRPQTTASQPKKIGASDSSSAKTPARPKFVHKDAIFWKGNWYWFSPKQDSFSEAGKHARAMKGRLVVISTPQENEFVASHVSGPTWLGLQRVKGSWLNAFGQRAGFFSWDVKQPSGSKGENFAAIQKSGKWHDYLADKLFYCVEWGSE